MAGILSDSDFDMITKLSLKNKVEQAYGVTVVMDATKAYNCHAYAFHISQGHANDYVWIGSSSSDEDIYWLGISNSNEYYDIFYDEYATSGFPEWNNYSSFEFFAETYRYVIEDNTAMLNRVPESAEFVRKTINHYFGSPDEPIYPEY